MSTDQHAPGRRRGSARSRVLETGGRLLHAGGAAATGIGTSTAPPTADREAELLFRECASAADILTAR